LTQQLDAGATFVLPDEREASIRLATSVLENLGVDPDDLNVARRKSREKMAEADLERYRDVIEKRKVSEKASLGKARESFTQAAVSGGAVQRATEQFSFILKSAQGFVRSVPGVSTQIAASPTVPTSKTRLGLNETLASSEDDSSLTDTQLGVTVCLLPSSSATDSGNNA